MYPPHLRAVLAFVLLLPIPLSAQSFRALRLAEPGDSVRVLGTDFVMRHGEFRRSHESVITLVVDGREMRFEPGSFHGMERFRKPNRFWKFAVPTMIGAGVGAAIGALTWSPCTETGFLACLLHPRSRSDQALLVGSITGVVGGIAGAVRAIRAKGEWEDVVVPHTAGGFTIAPAPVGGMGFGYRIPSR
ncbi:MAG: hypothetical protein RLN75_06155 [Longimicrobiales bacterium]